MPSVVEVSLADGEGKTGVSNWNAHYDGHYDLVVALLSICIGDAEHASKIVFCGEDKCILYGVYVHSEGEIKFTLVFTMFNQFIWHMSKPDEELIYIRDDKLTGAVLKLFAVPAGRGEFAKPFDWYGFYRFNGKETPRCEVESGSVPDLEEKMVALVEEKLALLEGVGEFMPPFPITDLFLIITTNEGEWKTKTIVGDERPIRYEKTIGDATVRSFFDGKLEVVQRRKLSLETFVPCKSEQVDTYTMPDDLHELCKEGFSVPL